MKIKVPFTTAEYLQESCEYDAFIARMPIVDTNGYEVVIYTTESKDPNFPIIGSYKDGNEWRHAWWAADGKSEEGDQELFFLKPAKSLGWVNLYLVDSMGKIIAGLRYDTKEMALDNTGNLGTLVSCIEVFEGQGL